MQNATTKLEIGHNKSTVRLTEGDTLSISLIEIPSAGYLWMPTERTKEDFDIMESEFVAAPHSDGVAGNGGKRIFTLKPKLDTTEVVLVHRQPWMPENILDRNFSVKVEVKV